ncbi:LPXTG-domain-containing protein cell wall anchor domain [Enterococcus silesiacus]|uniref:LPXTG-domain-containing protein cell wall anchor domain n=1 Tax=Enterococcus silesiacus TaxID=332949 RepID=A0AA91GIC4_9ENTE|nr:LPXTG cell wall anchor domain-containing protein [Enterococcus silesiacus]OJG92270.1 LPXTG-domain-containing protein cell wall anchor domain [Enterococcus silesiacus]
MKHKTFILILLSITFIMVSLLQSSKAVNAVNYDTEIGLTFNSDVAAASSESTTTTSDSSTDTTSESSTSASKAKTQYSKAESEKSVISRVLPSTGSENNNFYLFFGFLILTTGFILLIFKSSNICKRLRK